MEFRVQGLALRPMGLVTHWNPEVGIGKPHPDPQRIIQGLGFRVYGLGLGLDLHTPYTILVAQRYPVDLFFGSRFPFNHPRKSTLIGMYPARQVRVNYTKFQF